MNSSILLLNRLKSNREVGWLSIMSKTSNQFTTWNRCWVVFDYITDSGGMLTFSSSESSPILQSIPMESVVSFRTEVSTLVLLPGCDNTFSIIRKHSD